MKELTVNDSNMLGFNDPEWPATQFADYFGIPGATGWIEGENFAVGLEVDGEFFIERCFVVVDRDEFWRILGTKYSWVHVDLVLNWKDMDILFEYLESGFFAFCNQGKIRCTYGMTEKQFREKCATDYAASFKELTC